MARRVSKTLTDAERLVMEVLWEVGEASVREVTKALSATKPVAYNTILTILGILHRKNYVTCRKEGRAHIYRAKTSRVGAQKEAVNKLVSGFFGGSRNAFAQYLVDEEGLDPVDLEELKRLSDAKAATKTKKRL